MAEEISLVIGAEGDAIVKLARCRRIQVVSLGSAPTLQWVRNARIILTNISATAETVVWVNLGKFSIPISIPPAATPVVNLILELFNGYDLVEITDFSIPNLPAGFAGLINLLLVE